MVFSVGRLAEAAVRKRLIWSTCTHWFAVLKKNTSNALPGRSNRRYQRTRRQSYPLCRTRTQRQIIAIKRQRRRSAHAGNTRDPQFRAGVTYCLESAPLLFSGTQARLPYCPWRCEAKWQRMRAVCGAASVHRVLREVPCEEGRERDIHTDVLQCKGRTWRETRRYGKGERDKDVNVTQPQQKHTHTHFRPNGVRVFNPHHIREKFCREYVADILSRLRRRNTCNGRSGPQHAHAPRGANAGT